MSLSERWSAELEELRALGRYYTLAAPAGVDFTSNDYLGYGSGRRSPCSAVPVRPRSGMASRLLRGQQPVWEEVEAQLARWHAENPDLLARYCGSNFKLQSDPRVTRIGA